MTKLILKYKRLMPTTSLALLKDKGTGKKNWRHRFRKKTSNSSAGLQEFKDYPYKRFTDIFEFEDYINEQMRGE